MGLAFVEACGCLLPHSALSHCLAMFTGRASAWTYSCLRGETALSPKQGLYERGYTKAKLNLKRPLVVLGTGPGRPCASPGFGVGPRLRLPGMRWTAPARCQSSDNHSASIIILPLSRSGSVPQADAKET